MTDTNKILGQSVTLADGTASVLYTAPESTSAVASGLFTVNTADANCSYSVYAVPNGGSVQITPAESGFYQKGTDIDGEAAYDFSGTAVSLSSDGTVVAVGAYGNDGNGTYSGHVRVYEWNSVDSRWDQKGGDIDGEASWDQSGYSVSLSSDGSIVAIGANANDGINAQDSGHVRVYEWNGSAWVQRGSDIDGEAFIDGLGSSVSLSSDGTIVAIGAPSNDGTTGNLFDDRGHVRVYEWSGSAWVQKGGDIDGEAASDYSGVSVSLSSDGTEVAIGAHWNGGNGTYSGHVRVYEWNGSAWVQKGSDIDGEAAYDESGYSVSLSSDGTIVAIGGPYNDGNGADSGHVRVYEWNGSAWVQKGSDIDGEALGDQSGYSVSLSSDGTIVAIGARFNDGINGTNSGHVRLYEWSGSAWVQRGSDIDGEAANDELGYSVSLSADGSIVAIGARLNDGVNGTDSGHVRVYEYLRASATVDSKHALIKSRSILIGEHHEIQRGIVLNSGDALWIEATDEVAVSLYGVEVS